MRMFEVKHDIRKLCGSLRIAYCLAMARTFGVYRYDITMDCGDGWMKGAIYIWRGKTWIVPKCPLSME